MTAKRCASLVVLIFTLALLACSPIIVNATTYYNYTYCDKNIYTYRVNKPQKYSRCNAVPGWTGTTTTAKGSELGYDTSYKEATYKEYKESNGNFYVLYSDRATGRGEVVKTNVHHSVDSEAVKRIHTTNIHWASNKSSSVIERITVTVEKAAS